MVFTLAVNVWNIPAKVFRSTKQNM